MSFLSWLESTCPGDDAHSGYGDKRPLLERCGACAEIYEAHQHALQETINTPEVENFLKAVTLEAEHQRERWKKNDPVKDDADWYWLIGWLGGKAITDPHEAGDPRSARERKLHRIITVAAAAANWHRATKGSA